MRVESYLIFVRCVFVYLETILHLPSTSVPCAGLQRRELCILITNDIADEAISQLDARTPLTFFLIKDFVQDFS